MKTKVEGKTWVVGVDEAGRGPLAGPVSVGIVAIPFDFDWELIPGVGDSKKIPEKKREALFLRAIELTQRKYLDFHVALVSEKVIDSLGITQAVAEGIQEGFKTLKLDPEETEVRLDGLLKAPAIFKNQQTIIKGDASEKVIGLASVLAKVTRDAYMVGIADRYPEYQFHIHKGYGTKKHIEALQKHGLSESHRISFCSRYTQG